MHDFVPAWAVGHGAGRERGDRQRAVGTPEHCPLIRREEYDPVVRRPAEDYRQDNPQVMHRAGTEIDDHRSLTLGIAPTLVGREVAAVAAEVDGRGSIVLGPRTP